jgi:hypothetical protein
MTPIRCTEDQIQEATRCFPCTISNFPCKYLGLPLSIYKLNKVDEKPIVDKVADRLPACRHGWPGGSLMRDDWYSLRSL